MGGVGATFDYGGFALKPPPFKGGWVGMVLIPPPHKLHTIPT